MSGRRSAAVGPDAQGVLTLDGAGWHKLGDKLRLPDNISLLPLLPYSPELKPLENIWQLLHQNFLASRVFDAYDAIVEACCEAWNALTAETIRPSRHVSGLKRSKHRAAGIKNQRAYALTASLLTSAGPLPHLISRIACRLRPTLRVKCQSG